MRFDELLRETTDELASEMRGPSASLARSAMAQGRRIRRIRRGRRLLAASSALLACAAILLPWAIMWRTPPTVATGGPLPGGWVITGAGTRLLDRASGEYVPLEVNGRVLPAPIGDRVLIDGPGDSLRLVGVRGTQPVTVDTTDIGGDYAWAPTGDRLVGRASQKEPFKSGFAVIDAKTGAVTKHWIDRTQVDCSRCQFSWARDGREIVVASADRSGGETAEKVSHLQLFDAATGAPTRTLPVTGMPSGPFSWSPDGRYVIANADMLATDWQLIEVSTGQSRPFPHDAVWATDDQLLTTDDGKVLTLRPDGTVTATTEFDIPGAGDPVSLGPQA